MDEEERERATREAGRAGLSFEVCSRDKNIRVLTDIMYNIEGQKVRGHYKLICHLKYRTNIQCVRGITVPHQL